MVDSRGRSHDVRNLFIVDGSIFVTSGGVNPGEYDSGLRTLHRRLDQEEPHYALRLKQERDVSHSLPTNPSFSEPQREALSALLDTLVPASEDGEIPVRGTSTSRTYLRTQASDFLPALVEMLPSFDASFADLELAERVAYVSEFSSSHPMEFAQLLARVYDAYYQDDRVREGDRRGQGTRVSAGQRAGPGRPLVAGSRDRERRPASVPEALADVGGAPSNELITITGSRA